MKNTSKLRISGDQIFLGGASAGGNLAVAATLELRDTAEPLPAGLVLAYPFLHQQLEVGAELEEILTEVPPLLRFTQSDIDQMYGAQGILHGHLNRVPAVPEVSSTLDRIASFLDPGVTDATFASHEPTPKILSLGRHSTPDFLTQHSTADREQKCRLDLSTGRSIAMTIDHRTAVAPHGV